MRISRWLLATGTGVALLASVSTAAFAADNYAPPSQIPTAAQCGTGAASGSFGAFGPGMNFGNSTSGHIGEAGNLNTPNGQGADGTATGDNNADVCGNS